MKMLNEVDKKNLEIYSVCPNTTCIVKESVYRNKETSIDLSIIVPCYNVEKYVKKCIDSLLNQETSVSYEIIAVDDGSKDATAKILDSYSGNPKLVIIHQTNGGIANARNRGMAEAKGAYLMFVDSDDYVSSDYIDGLMSMVVLNNADMVACSHSVFMDDKVLKTVRLKTGARIESIIGCPWGKVFRRELFDKVVFPSGYWYEDSIYRHLIVPQIKNYCITEKGMYYYRRNYNGVTQNSAHNFKALDTIYISDLMISAVRDLLGEKYVLSDEYYQILMKQFFLNQRRVIKLPKDVQQLVFAIQSSYIKENYPKPLKSTLYEKSLYSGNFRKSIIAVKWNRWLSLLNTKRK